MPNRRVLIVDDSITIRMILQTLFLDQPDIDLVAIANNADEVPAAIAHYRPDVLTLDIWMPGVDGLSLLSTLMRERPIPIVVVSSSGGSGSEETKQALALGAAGCFDKSRIVSDSRKLIRLVKRARVRTPARSAAGARLQSMSRMDA